MKLSDLFSYVKSLSENDQSILDEDIYRWVDSAIDRINVACQCNIPKTTGQPTTYEPEFDPRFHEALLLFAEARYRESDSDYNSAAYFMSTFNDMIRVMQRDMIIKPSQRVDYTIQQIVVTDATVLTYNLTMPISSYYSNLVVYYNDAELDKSNYKIAINTKTITFYNQLAVNDKITIEFVDDSALNNAPYEWWESTGW